MLWNKISCYGQHTTHTKKKHTHTSPVITSIAERHPAWSCERQPCRASAKASCMPDSVGLSTQSSGSQPENYHAHWVGGRWIVMNRYRNPRSHWAGVASALRCACDTEQDGGVWFFFFLGICCLPFLKQHIWTVWDLDKRLPDKTSATNSPITELTMSHCVAGFGLSIFFPFLLFLFESFPLFTDQLLSLCITNDWFVMWVKRL